MMVGDTYTIKRYNEDTGVLTNIVMKVISNENGVIEAIQVEE